MRIDASLQERRERKTYPDIARYEITKPMQTPARIHEFTVPCKAWWPLTEESEQNIGYAERDIRPQMYGDYESCKRGVEQNCRPDPPYLRLGQTTVEEML